MEYPGLIVPLIVLDCLLVPFLIAELRRPGRLGLTTRREQIETGPSWLVVPRTLLKKITAGSLLGLLIGINLIPFLGWDRLHIALIVLFAIPFLSSTALKLTDQYIRKLTDQYIQYTSTESNNTMNSDPNGVKNHEKSD